MSDKYEFPNHPADERYPDKEEKSDTAWIGIANSTKHNLKVRTEVGRDAAGDIFELNILDLKTKLLLGRFEKIWRGQPWCQGPNIQLRTSGLKFGFIKT